MKTTNPIFLLVLVILLVLGRVARADRAVGVVINETNKTLVFPLVGDFAASNNIPTFTTGDARWASWAFAQAVSNLVSGTVTNVFLTETTAASSAIVSNRILHITIRTNAPGGGGGGGGDVSLTNVVALVSTTNVVSDVSLACAFTLTATNNFTLANPTNSLGLAINGRAVRWRIKQDGTGNRTVTLGNKFRFASSVSLPLAWSTTANKTDIFSAIYDAAADKWDVVAMVPGY